AAVTAAAAASRAAGATDRRPPQRTIISCTPQSTQKAERCRRDAACFASLHGGLESCAFTIPPHCGQMSSASEAQKAIAEFNGKDLQGRTLNVSEARERLSGGGDRGRGGFSGRRSY